MKVLHLISDWKWTGPAEPTVSLCEALCKAGVDITIAYRKTPIDFPERTIEKEVLSRGIPSNDSFRLNRYFSFRDWCWDIRSIGKYVSDNEIDIVHANLSHDHFTAIFALKFSKKKTLLVRTDHKRDGLPKSPFMKWALSRTDGLVAYSRKIIEGDLERFKLSMESTCVIPPAIKLFDGSIENLRGKFGISGGDKVIGVIGRLKPDRGFDVILKGFKLLRERVGGVKLLIMGRSSQIEKSVIEPLRALGLENDVILAGYHVEDYFSVIALFDFFVMMRAGSDGTARALREVMSLGVPAIVSNLGMLPDLVDDGKSGYVVEYDAQNLAAKMELLVKNEKKCKIFGEAAKLKAYNEWSYPSQAQKMIEFYEFLLR